MADSIAKNNNIIIFQRDEKNMSTKRRKIPLVTDKTKDDSICISAKTARREVISDLAKKVKLSQEKNPGKTGGEGIIKEASLLYPWITRNMVYGSIRRLKFKVVLFVEG